MPRNFTEIAIVLCAIFWSQTLIAQEPAIGEFSIEDHSGISSISEEDPEDLDWETTLSEDTTSDKYIGSVAPADAAKVPSWEGWATGPETIGVPSWAGWEGGVTVPAGTTDGPSWVPGGSPAQNGDFMEGEATRIFAGPSEFPPENFGAYAILVFKSLPLESELSRYLMICEAYRTSIPDAAAAKIPENQQLVTVWPVKSDEVAKKISVEEEEKKCSIAVRNYDLVTALRAVKHARITDKILENDFANRRGPFLLAWNPSSSKGHADALILRMDLSKVDMPHQAKKRMEFWVQKIEMHPERWLDGWQPQTIREEVADMADDFGEEILAFFGPGSQ